MPVSVETYIAQTDALLNRLGSLDDDVMRAIQRAARTMRAELDGAIRAIQTAGVARLDITRAALLRDQFAAPVARFEQEVQSILSGAMPQAVDMGEEGAEYVANLLDIPASTVRGVSPQLAAAAVNNSAGLVTGLTGNMRKDIEGVISRAGLGALTPYEAMKQVDDIVGLAPGTGVTAKAERIVRTELTRTYNLAHQGGINALHDNLDEDEAKLLEKRWQSALQPGRSRQAHVNADGDRVPVKDRKGREGEFIVWGEKLRFPGDPRGSARNTINCLCRMVTAVEKVLAKRLEDEIPGDVRSGPFADVDEFAKLDDRGEELGDALRAKMGADYRHYYAEYSRTKMGKTVKGRMKSNTSTSQLYAKGPDPNCPTWARGFYEGGLGEVGFNETVWGELDDIFRNPRLLLTSEEYADAFDTLAHELIHSFGHGQRLSYGGPTIEMLEEGLTSLMARWHRIDLAELFFDRSIVDEFAKVWKAFSYHDYIDEIRVLAKAAGMELDTFAHTLKLQVAQNDWIRWTADKVAANRKWDKKTRDAFFESFMQEPLGMQKLLSKRKYRAQ